MTQIGSPLTANFKETKLFHAISAARTGIAVNVEVLLLERPTRSFQIKS